MTADLARELYALAARVQSGEARVCGYCLTYTGLCVECDAEQCRNALPKGVRQQAAYDLQRLGRMLERSDVSPHIAQAALLLIDDWREDTRRHTAFDNRRKHVA